MTYSNSQKRISSFLVQGLILAAFLSPAAAQFSFDKYDFVTGSAKRETVLTGFLLGGAIADIATLHIDSNGDRRLAVYVFERGNWRLRLRVNLNPGAMFVDIANIGGRDRLVYYERGRMKWFDPDSGKDHELVTVTSSFDPPRTGEIPHVDITRDVNGDGRDDLVIPENDGFGVFIQSEDGTFADPVKTGSPPEMGGIYGADGYRYDPWTQSRIHEIDYNRDGRTDLVFWNDDHFDVHYQDESGLFAAAARNFATTVAFNSDELTSLTDDLLGRMLYSLTDLNGDGIGDMIIFSLEGEKIGKKRSSFELHFGKPAPAGTVWAPEADTAIRSDKRIHLRMDLHDLNRDGRAELIFTAIRNVNLKSSLLWNFRGLMGGSVILYPEFYRLEGGRYPFKPNAIRKIKLRFPPAHSEPGWMPLEMALRGGTDENITAKERLLGAFNSTLLVGDVTGDGRSDLLITWKRGQMLVFMGVPGPGLFTVQPQKLEFQIPYDGEYAWLVDVNKDGKQDVQMHYSSTDDANRMTLLIAR